MMKFDWRLVLWLIGAVVVVAALLWLALEWAALTIARRVAEAAEARIAAGIGRGMGRAGIDTLGVVDPAARERYLAQIDRLAWLMDRALPLPVVGGIGLDFVLGLVPVAGDAISGLISSFIVIRAAQLGVPREVLARLIAIQVTDFLAGVVPVAGDLIDAAYKADVRSAALIRDVLTDRTPKTSRR